MKARNPKVDDFIRNAKAWPKELMALRKIVLACGLSEAFKWRGPCYTFEGGNVAMLGELKACCTLSFFKGALLNDPHGMLDKPGPNSRSARVIRFTSVEQIKRHGEALKFLLEQAIELERAGTKVDFAADREMDVPSEFQARLDNSPSLQTAFAALTPGRQRGYLIHFAGAKTSKGRASRVEKYVDRILAGKGIHDCLCGLSRKMPSCDGSHNSIQ